MKISSLLLIPYLLFSTPDLTVLANKYLSDKGDQYPEKHHYTRHYQKLFDGLWDRPVHILEIGLNRFDRLDCASLRIWLDSFPNSQIYGMDIKPQTFADPRVSIWIGSQGDPVFLNLFASSLREPLNIVIDDGSHASLDQQISLAYLFPSVKPGGMYIIEDLKTEPWPAPAGVITTGAWLKRWKTKKKMKNVYIPQYLLDNLVDQIESIEFYDSATIGEENFVVIRKKGG